MWLGLAPSVVFGVEVSGVAPSHLKLVRSQAAAAFGCVGPMRSVELGVVLDGRHDPADEAVTHVTMVPVRCGVVASHRPSTLCRHQARISLPASWLTCLVQFGTQSRRDGWNQHVQGLFSVMVCSLHRIGWKTYQSYHSTHSRQHSIVAARVFFFW